MGVERGESETERVIDDTRIWGRRFLGGHGESEELRHRRSKKAVVPPCFISEPEEPEEEVRAEDRSPSTDLVRTDSNSVLIQYAPRDLEDAGVS